ncbi:MutS-related protein [Chitinophaga polysaccharea]|uniref:MutS-related protein n=1 Tax=Chitinophaga polysaccharea TaxID=1293035 RepID=UPI0011586B51|nr:DNA mismatch repair protein [Chitinophaga polysaccharea]
MSFSVDKQTLDELNLLGKFKEGSVYNLFNQVNTTGGEQMLEKMFLSPLDNATDINSRVEILQYFQRQLPGFPFDYKTVEMMQEFMDGQLTEGGLMIMGRVVAGKLLARLTRDERYGKIVRGLQSIIQVLQACDSFVKKMSADRADHPYKATLQNVEAILAIPRVKTLLASDIYAGLSLKTVAYYYYQLKKQLYTQMHTLLSFIYEVDVWVAVSDVARSKNMTYPQAMAPEENKLLAMGLCHPTMEKAVGNSCVMHTDNNVMFLTGANMAGKSTWMKTIGIAVYLAHMGFPVSAEKMVFSVRDGLYTSINVADNVNLGYSHFYAEVVRVKQAAEAVSKGQRLILMFDELFKGTNVKDAYDGTLAVSAAFSAYRNCLFVISTHIIEVAAALKEYPNIRFVYMPTIMEGAKPGYTYTLKEGVTEDRQGMIMIRNEGILELLDQYNTHLFK